MLAGDRRKLHPNELSSLKPRSHHVGCSNKCPMCLQWLGAPASTHTDAASSISRQSNLIESPTQSDLNFPRSHEKSPIIQSTNPNAYSYPYPLETLLLSHPLFLIAEKNKREKKNDSINQLCTRENIFSDCYATD